MKKDTTLRDKNGAEIREGCLIRTKALSGERQEYEDFKVIRFRGKLNVQKRDMWGNVRTFSIAYLQRWKGDDSMEVMWSPQN